MIERRLQQNRVRTCWCPEMSVDLIRLAQIGVLKRSVPNETEAAIRVILWGLSRTEEPSQQVPAGKSWGKLNLGCSIQGLLVASYLKGLDGDLVVGYPVRLIGNRLLAG